MTQAKRKSELEKAVDIAFTLLFNIPIPTELEIVDACRKAHKVTDHACGFLTLKLEVKKLLKEWSIR